MLKGHGVDSHGFFRRVLSFLCNQRDQSDSRVPPRDGARTSSTRVPSVTATRRARQPRYVEDSLSCFCLEMSWASFSDRYTSSCGS